jgi:hypothetical protein
MAVISVVVISKQQKPSGSQPGGFLLCDVRAGRALRGMPAALCFISEPSLDIGIDRPNRDPARSALRVALEIAGVEQRI